MHGQPGKWAETDWSRAHGLSAHQGKHEFRLNIIEANCMHSLYFAFGDNEAGRLVLRVLSYLLAHLVEQVLQGCHRGGQNEGA